jgi:hypothetical protein
MKSSIEKILLILVGITFNKNFSEFTAKWGYCEEEPNLGVGQGQRSSQLL